MLLRHLHAVILRVKHTFFAPKNIRIQLGSGGSVISRVTRQGTGWSGVGIPIGARFLCSPNRSDQLWDTSIHASNEYGREGGFFSGLMLTTNFYPVPSLRSTAKPPLPIYALMTWTGTTSPFPSRMPRSFCVYVTKMLYLEARCTEMCWKFAN